MKTIDKINEAIKSLKELGITPTQKLVCKESGLSIATVKRHWKGITNSGRESVKSNRVSPNKAQGITNRVSKESNQGITKPSNPAFERLKRYKPSGNLKLNPTDF